MVVVALALMMGAGTKAVFKQKLLISVSQKMFSHIQRTRKVVLIVLVCVRDPSKKADHLKPQIVLL